MAKKKDKKTKPSKKLYHVKAMHGEKPVQMLIVARKKKHIIPTITKTQPHLASLEFDGKDNVITRVRLKNKSLLASVEKLAEQPKS